MDYPCGKFDDYSFNGSGNFYRVDRDTDRRG